MFESLNPHGYQLIMADVPWTFRTYSEKGIGKSAQAKYQCMSLDDIKAMPVASLADPAGCLLIMWATNPLLPEAIEVMRAWGFRYVTAGHWVKRTAKNKLAFGTGYVLRGAGEPFLVGKIGKPLVESRSVRSVIEGLAREHSRKPDEAYAAAERLMPKANRLELFSRESRAGWTTYGNERTKFDLHKVPAEKSADIGILHQE